MTRGAQTILAGLLVALLAGWLGAASGEKTFALTNRGAKTAPGGRVVEQPANGDSRAALRIDFAAGSWPSARLPFRDAADLERGVVLLLDVTNGDREDVVIHLRLDVSEQQEVVDASRGAWAWLPAGKRQWVAVPLRLPPPLSQGMREPPRWRGALTASPYGPPFDLTRTASALGIYLKEQKRERSLLLHEVKIVEGDPARLWYEGVVDRFGQAMHESWTGKILAEDDLRRAAAAETGDEPAQAVDAFYGWTDGPRDEGTGYFRTIKRDGRWWFVTPDGTLFLSLGVNAVQTEVAATYVEGRESLFTWLPPPDDPLADHFGRSDNRGDTPVGQVRRFDRGRWFNFYTANLERKYGDDFAARWPVETLTRFRRWGFNTVANWSSEHVTRATDRAGRRMPYVHSLWYGGDYPRIGTAADWWGPMPDPFDPRFAEAVAHWLEPKLQALSSDQYLIGYFVDNELSWAVGRNSDKDQERFSLVHGVLRQRADSAAKRALLEQLRSRHQEISRLNATWQTSFASWEAFLAEPYSPPSELSSAMRDDFSRFARAFAEQYFRVIATLIRQHDPNHLYLGCRFSTFAIEHVEGCAAWCDVVSFNLYAPDLAAAGDFTFLEKIDKPALVGEFHFGAMDRGGFGGGLVPVATQEQRARGYVRYIESLFAHPSFVGAHWFQYLDQPITGRLFDGENYAVGLVDVADNPYPELTAAAARINRETYRRRLTGARPGSPETRTAP